MCKVLAFATGERSRSNEFTNEFGVVRVTTIEFDVLGERKLGV